MTKGSQSIITLLTDFGTRDGYVGMMKGVILSINPKVRLVDLCHEIPPHDITSGAYVLFSSYRYFPPGTVHIAVIDPGVGSERKIVGMKAGGWTFLAPDNGILSLVAEREKIEVLIHVDNPKYFLTPVSDTFHGRDCFASASAYLSSGLELKKLGSPITRLKKAKLPKSSVSSEGVVSGKIIYVDRFGNLVTDISREKFEKFQKKLPRDLVEIRVGGRRIHRISHSYAEVKPSHLLAVFGSSDFLEISVNQGNAQKTLKMGKGGTIELKRKVCP